MTRKAVLFSEMTPGATQEDEFNHWYDTEHIPPRMQAPGFVSAQRFRNADGPAYLALYELQDKSALLTPEYKDIKASSGELTRRIMAGAKDVTRYIGEEISSWKNPLAHNASSSEAAWVYAVFFTVPAPRTEAFDRWYEEDHIPTLLGCSDWLAVRRFRIVDGEPQPFTHLALHYLATADALQSSAREQANNSPWRMQLAQEEWFKAHSGVFRGIGQPFVAART
ncbi:DUF4286 family protein [Pseudomonas izuensis]|uniref:DUF4286 family protein n=1 Tax=Pseudomonas izuensis TaxID=2684212 RepID=UPI0013576C75|nr:DUF4286 family protein [Pseudomonas izuensis]